MNKPSTSSIYNWIRERKAIYTNGLHRETTIVLLASAVVLTLHRYLNRRSFFRQNFADYFVDHPLAAIYPHYYWFLTTAILLLLLPVLIVKYGIKGRIRDFGFSFDNGKLGWGFAIGGWLLMIPVLILAVKLFPSFQQKYPLNKLATTNWGVFISYEISYGIYMFAWEYFFRGFMLFGLERRFGNDAILIQTIPFAVMHFSKPLPEAMGSIFAGILLGVVALETRSFIYGAAIHWFVATSMDVVAILSR